MQATTWTTVEAAEGLPQKRRVALDAVAPAAVNVAGIELAFLEAGSRADPCLLWIHGFPRNAYLWRRCLAPMAAAGWRSVAPDLLGLGESAGPQSADFSLANQARLLGYLLDALEARHCCVVGEGIGAVVGRALALRDPPRVRGLALLDPYTDYIPVLSHALPAQLARLGYGRAVLGVWRLSRALAAPRVERDLYLRPLLDGPVARARTEAFLASLLSLEAAAIDAAFRTRAAALPTLVCRGPARGPLGGLALAPEEPAPPRGYALRLAESPVRIVERDPAPLLEILGPFLEAVR